MGEATRLSAISPDTSIENTTESHSQSASACKAGKVANPYREWNNTAIGNDHEVDGVRMALQRSSA
jgi:hypothetical protein